MLEFMTAIVLILSVAYLFFLIFNGIKLSKAFINEKGITSEMNNDELFIESLIADLKNVNEDFLFTSGTCYPKIWGNKKVVDAIKHATSKRNVRIRGIIETRREIDKQSEECENFRNLIKNESIQLSVLDEEGNRIKETLKEKYASYLQQYLDSEKSYPHFDFRVFDDSVHIHFHVDVDKLAPERRCVSAQNLPDTARELRSDFNRLATISNLIDKNQL